MNVVEKTHAGEPKQRGRIQVLETASGMRLTEAYDERGTHGGDLIRMSALLNRRAVRIRDLGDHRLTGIRIGDHDMEIAIRFFFKAHDGGGHGEFRLLGRRVPRGVVRSRISARNGERAQGGNCCRFRNLFDVIHPGIVQRLDVPALRPAMGDRIQAHRRYHWRDGAERRDDQHKRQNEVLHDDEYAPWRRASFGGASTGSAILRHAQDDKRLFSVWMTRDCSVPG